MDWSSFDGKTYKPRKMIGRAFLPVFYETMGWAVEREYIVQGECFGNGRESFLAFDLRDAEAIIRKPVTSADTNRDPGKSNNNDAVQQIVAIPTSWIKSFGSDYYSEEMLPLSHEGEWDTQDRGTPLPRNDPFKATGQRELKKQITSIISEIKDGTTDG